jgi:hypothetical protein
MQLSGDTTAGAILYSLLLLVFTAGLIAIGEGSVVFSRFQASNRCLTKVFAAMCPTWLCRVVCGLENNAGKQQGAELRVGWHATARRLAKGVCTQGQMTHTKQLLHTTARV